MHPDFNVLTIPIIALYAETHFRFFRLFPSLIFQKKPEVIFDMPKRVDPGQDLPILLIANDIDRFPADFSDCSVAISKPGTPPVKFDFQYIEKFSVDHPLRNSMKVYLLRIPHDKLPQGHIFINCCVSIRRDRKAIIVLNDNLRTTSKLPFSCYIANDRLPGSDLCSYGDVHLHSAYSQSHVEFGPPLVVIDAMAAANGLAFCGITDHSYDLACSIEDYLQPDPKLQRWRLFQEEIRNSGNFQTIMIPGEEVSCLNSAKKVVHLCGLNLNEFLPGSLDGARKGRFKEAQLTVQEAIKKIHEQGGISFAAHPGAHMGIMQRIFLHRGEWADNDLRPDLDAMQIFNNGLTLLLDRGKLLWKNMLHKEYKVPLLAGNDAHGDFSRYRALAVPFLSVGDNPDRFMGSGKTGIYGIHGSAAEVVSGIREGATFITTGPFASITASPSPAQSIISNSPVENGTGALFVHAVSTPEFGAVRKIMVYAGEKGPAAEKTVFSRDYCGQEYSAVEKIVLEGSVTKPSSYLRAEVRCAPSALNLPSAALTSPVYFK